MTFTPIFGQVAHHLQIRFSSHRNLEFNLAIRTDIHRGQLVYTDVQHDNGVLLWECESQHPYHKDLRDDNLVLVLRLKKTLDFTGRSSII